MTDTVMLDLDNVSFKTARYWARWSMKFFDLWGFIILKSSKDHYHAVFDRTVTWSENMSIVSSAVINSRNLGLQRWFNQQCRKIGSTLRVGPKGDKPSPRIVYREGREDDRIKNFLKFRRQIKNIMKRVNTLASL